MSQHSAKIRVAGLGAVVVLAATLLAPAAVSAEQTRTLQRSFPVVDGQSLRLATLVGTASIEQGAGDQVEIRAVVHAEGDDAAETARLLSSLEWVEAEDRGKRVWALSWPTDDFTHYRSPERNGWWGETRTEYLGRRVRISSRGGVLLYAELTIRMPAGADLAVRQVVGPIRAGALEGNLELDTGSGDVKVASLQGRLDVDTGSGTVAVGMVHGGASIDTGSGNVDVAMVRGNADIDTGSGDVTVQAIEGDSLAVDTGSGSVRVSHARVARLEADTGSGDVELIDSDAEHILGDTGSGNITLIGPLVRAARVDFDTGSGDVRIRGGADASFRLTADQGSGDLRNGFTDAHPIAEGRRVVGYERGDGRTLIAVDTGSGDCVIEPL